MRKQNIYRLSDLLKHHSGNNSHSDLNSDLLILNSGPSPNPYKGLLQLPLNTSRSHISWDSLFDMLPWRVTCSFPVEYQRMGLIPLWHDRPSNVWNHNPITFKSLFLNPTSQLNSLGTVLSIRPKMPSAWGSWAFQRPMGVGRGESINELALSYRKANWK